MLITGYTGAASIATIDFGVGSRRYGVCMVCGVCMVYGEWQRKCSVPLNHVLAVPAVRRYERKRKEYRNVHRLALLQRMHICEAGVFYNVDLKQSSCCPSKSLVTRRNCSGGHGAFDRG